ncbi:MAG: hypothetical protein BAJALOKI1v1_270012 [Promethearchaeota archaeon]|nr:MAG: hypothetical protein BAJALOKI1v1_270012 [Candidatus Lokiarchaeota archaeon]
MYCYNCGAIIKSEEQQYCEECGTKLRKTEDSSQKKEEPRLTPSHSPQTQEVVPPDAGLFDMRRNFYVLKEKYWDWGGGDIYDKKGNAIGKMNRKFFDLHRTIEITELDGRIMATIQEKIISIRGENRLLDENGNLMAIFKKKITSVIHPKFWLESPDGIRWYEAKGEFMGWSFAIREISSGKTVAEIEKADRWRDIFLGGFFDFQDTYALRILDNETDRRILIGFVLSIDNVLHDNHHGMGFPMPWGPGRWPGPRRGPLPGRWPGRGRFPGPGRFPGRHRWPF